MLPHKLIYGSILLGLVAAVAVINGGGRVAGVRQGGDPGDTALAFLRSLPEQGGA